MKMSKSSLVLPQQLFTDERLDIAVKWRFFHHLKNGGDPDSERVYRWHIHHRTGGREPRSSKWKQSVDDYVYACKNLLESMQIAGFHKRWPLEYGRNGRLRDGAHRLACSLLLEETCFVQVINLDGNAIWGKDWFVRHGISRGDLERIEADFECLRKHCL